VVTATHDDPTTDDPEELELPPDVGESEGDRAEVDTGDPGIVTEEEDGGLDDAPARELAVGEVLDELDEAPEPDDDKPVDAGEDGVDFEDAGGEEGTGLEGMPEDDVEVGELPADVDGGAEGTGEDPAREVDEDGLPPLGEGDDGEGPD